MVSKTWLITGASRGLGYEIAKAALAAGHEVIACRRSASRETEAAAQLEKLGGVWIELDVTADDVAAKVDGVLQKYGKIDVLVNNAGIGHGNVIEDAR